MLVEQKFILNFKHFEKEILKSDGPQFNQYQQNEQSPLTSSNWTQKKATEKINDLWNPGHGQFMIMPMERFEELH